MILLISITIIRGGNKIVKKLKNGFTIVELVIVIAVIAILAVILIPTFSNIISKAEAAKIYLEADNIYKSYLTNELKNDNIPRYLVIKVEEDKYIFYINGSQQQTPCSKNDIESQIEDDNNKLISFEEVENYPNILVIKTEIGDVCEKSFDECNHAECVIIEFDIIDGYLCYRKLNNKTGECTEWKKVMLLDSVYGGPY